MRLDVHIWRGLALLCLSLQANADDPGATFNAAKAYAQGTVDGTGGIVSAEKAATLPHYTTNSPVPSLVPGDVGLGGAGIGKIQGCVGQADNECAAVNFLAKNPDSRLRFNITPSDPSVLAGKHAIDNAGAVYRSLGDGREGGESACTTKTTTTPAQYTTETCTSLRGIEGQECTMGREVVIDAKTNYQCVDTQNSVNAYACKKTLNVSFPNAASIGFTNWPATVTLADGAGGVGENFFRPVASVYLPAGSQGTIQVTGYLSVYAEKNLSIGIDKDGVMQYSALVFYCDGYCTGTRAFNISANVTGGGTYRFMVYLWGAYNSDKLAGGSVTFAGNVSVCPSGYTWSASRGGCYGAPVPTWSNECATFEAKAQ